jgi:hypothetical protein
MRLPGVADRQSLPYMPIGFAPVHDSAAVPSVNLHVYRTVWGASVLDAAGLDSCNDVVKPGLAHTKAIMLYGKVTIGLIEVEGQAFVHIHRAEGTNAGFCPRNAEDGGQQPRCRLSVPGWNYRVVKLNAHPGLSYREQWVVKVVMPDVEAVRPDAAGGRSAPARCKTSFIWPPCYAQQPFSNCMGGHLTLAKEQNTQQSPANGLSILRHPLHS